MSTAHPAQGFGEHDGGGRRLHKTGGLMTIDYTGWEPYLERGGEPDYCEDAEPEEAPEELADDDSDEWAADDEAACNA